MAVLLVLFAVWMWPRASCAQILEKYIPTNITGFDVNPGVTVISRLRPEYDAPGIRVGEVVFRPQVLESVGYDTAPVPGQNGGSSLVISQAKVTADTQWSRNHLGVGASVYDVRYLSLPLQSYTNWNVGINGSYDIGRDTILAEYAHYNLNQLPTGVGSVGLQQPQPYQSDEATIGYRSLHGPWTFVPTFRVDAIRYSNLVNPDGTVQTGNASDRNVETASLETLYEVATQRSIVFVVRETSAQYLNGQPRRNYNDLAVLAGLDFGAEGVFRYRALAGYEFRNYENAAYKSHAAPIVEGSVIWTATGLTTVTGSVIYRIEDANEDAFLGYQYTRLRLGIDHEYLRNVLLQGYISVENANYLQSSTHQTLYDAGIGVTWLLNRNVRLTASYDFSYTQQNAAPGNYARNIMLLQLRFGL